MDNIFEVFFLDNHGFFMPNCIVPHFQENYSYLIKGNGSVHVTDDNRKFTWVRHPRQLIYKPKSVQVCWLCDRIINSIYCRANPLCFRQVTRLAPSSLPLTTYNFTPLQNLLTSRSDVVSKQRIQPFYFFFVFHFHIFAFSDIFGFVCGCEDTDDQLDAVAATPPLNVTISNQSGNQVTGKSCVDVNIPSPTFILLFVVRCR